MLAVLLFGLFAATTAAPHRHGSWPSVAEHSRLAHYDPFEGDVFDTRQFWAQLANEMRQIDEMLATFSQRFPSMASEARIEGNQFKITIPLSGFDEKDIVVKAKEGFLMVQAVQKLPEGGERMYLDAKTIPTYVNVTGTWTYEQGVLKIVFPLKTDAGVTEVAGVTEAAVVTTERPVFKDREEMDSDSSDDNNDADVGLRGDSNKDNELFTNEIPGGRVKATTYSVDLKDEVEFVPVGHY